MKNINVDSLHVVPVKNNTRVWLVTYDGHILLSNDIYSHNRLLNFGDITLEADNINQLMTQIEQKWGILVTENDMRLEYFEAYKENNQNKHTDVYFLELDLTKEEKGIVADRYNGEFYDIKKFPMIINIKLNKSYQRTNSHYDMLFSVLLHKYNL